MRYSGTHKEETRKKVVKAAAAAVRAKGPDGVAVAEVMAEAGLTHGGFYAHFRNKEALIVAALEEAFAESRRRFARLTEGLDRQAALGVFVDAYVSMAHRARRARGCPVTALASELPRQPEAVRAAFDAGLRGMIGRIAAWLPETEPDRDGLAASLVAEMAGAVTLSRAVADDDLAERLLADCRRSIKARMGAPEDPSQ
ncbi:TetR/AcrR family transcriptional regulator [Phenylobacterium sp. VNQ135]|uniref:TetR/AcrR family transcriptional regulator n=1 Tax=Phenylobacterium sp. VNQ135 TaxID=3400922 RepID=UPI003C125A5D